jgi:hypothetical protein
MTNRVASSKRWNATFDPARICSSSSSYEQVQLLVSENTAWNRIHLSDSSIEVMEMSPEYNLLEDCTLGHKHIHSLPPG